MNGIVFGFLAAMTEQQFTYEMTECCKRVLNGNYLRLVDEAYIDNINFKYYEDNITWVEYYGTKLERDDKKAIDIIGRVMHAVCTKYNIIFLKCVAD